jgi:hypothetical protein
MSEPRPIEVTFKTDVQYHEYECAQCGKTARNTYIEPVRVAMLERRLCYHCNYWADFAERLKRDHKRMTIIGGHVYGPGSRTSGAMLGMAGRRFDIEYVEPSDFAGKRITTFDLWSGSEMPPELSAQFPDTARFLNGAEKVTMSGPIETCWDSSDPRAERYPPPNTLRLA